MKARLTGRRMGFLSAGGALLAVSLIACADPKTTGNGVRVNLETELGSIVVEVFPKAAPLSAGDFLAYVDASQYDGAGFYRTVRVDNDNGDPTIEVVQGGLLDRSKARPPIAHENTDMTGLKHVDGTLSLARSEVGTGSAAAFFITLGDQPSLDYGGTRNKDRQGFAAFGRVVSGMEVIRRIHRMKSDAGTDDAYLKGQILKNPVRIVKASRVEAK